VARLLVSLVLAFLLFGHTLGYPLLQAVPAPDTEWGWVPLVGASYALDTWLAGGADWGHRLTQVVLLGLLAWGASGAVERSWRRALVLSLVVVQPVMIGAVMDPSARGELLLAVFGTLAITSRGVAGGIWTLLALASHPLGSLVPLLGWRRAGTVRRVPWRLAVVILWWAGWLAAHEGVLGGLDSWTDGWAAAGAHAGLYVRQLAIPLEPTFWRSLPAFTPEQCLTGWAGLGGLIIAGALAWWWCKQAGAEALRGAAVIALPLLLGVALGEGGDAYLAARLAWPVVGLAWLLAAFSWVRRLAVILVPLWLVITVIRVDDHVDAATLWGRHHARLPGDRAIHLRLAAELAESDPAQAVELLEAVVAGPLPRAEALSVRRSLVGAYTRMGMPERSRPHLAQIADPEESGTMAEQVRRCQLAALYGDVVWAEERASVMAVCASALAAYPDDPELRMDAGIAAFGAGEPQVARDHLIAAAERWPDNTAIRQLLSQVPLMDVTWQQSGPTSPAPGP